MMIVNALKIASTTRAQVGRQLDSYVQETLSVVGAQGNIQGMKSAKEKGVNINSFVRISFYFNTHHSNTPHSRFIDSLPL